MSESRGRRRSAGLNPSIYGVRLAAPAADLRGWDVVIGPVQDLLYTPPVSTCPVCGQTRDPRQRFCGNCAQTSTSPRRKRS
jgi:hypothetical protein